MYRDGLGLTADSARAFNFFQSASSDNLAEAQVNLGKLYLGSSRSSPFHFVTDGLRFEQTTENIKSPRNTLKWQSRTAILSRLSTT